MRLDRLTTLADYLEKTIQPGWLYMGTWAEDGFDKQECGTTACAMGGATQCFPDELELIPGAREGESMDVRVRGTNYHGYAAAINFFEIPNSVAVRLFCPDYYEDYQLDDERAVIERIRNLVAENS